jgi:adenine deaminase
VKYGGLSETEALAMVTLNPAKQLGIENRVGSIEVGKDADLVIYDKFPLSDYAKVLKVLIDGKVYFDRDNEVSARSAKQAEKQKLIDKEHDKEKQQRAPQGAPGRRAGQ